MARTLRGAVLQRSDRTVMILASIFALVAAVLVFVVLSNSSSDDSTSNTTNSATTTSVAVASQDIPAGTRLTADMLTVSTVPQILALTGVFSGVSPIVGLTTRADLLKGEQVTASKIGEAQKDDKSLSLLVPQGLRAVAIPAEETSTVGGLIIPGDMVDVIVVFPEQSLTLLQNVQVLAVGQVAEVLVPVAAGASATPGVLGRAPTDTEPQPSAGSLTLAVTQVQAQMLALAQQNGKLIATLRPRGENSSVPIDPSGLSQIGIAQ
jgi:pilus assembly protein CpaB